MKSVVNNKNTIIIKNSRFITLIYRISKKEDVNYLLKDAKIAYPEATHYCYAYILNGDINKSDDGEPAGTAGVPILEVLQKNELNYCLCIVIRYFGKIKLGASGLVRAYTQSVALCLRNSITELKEGYHVKLTFPYSSLKKVDYLLKDSDDINKSFLDLIIYDLKIDKEKLNLLKKMPDLKIEIIEELYL